MMIDPKTNERIMPPRAAPSEKKESSAVSMVVERKPPLNPKDALGAKKVPIRSVLSAGVIAEVAVGMGEGACKYGRHNYRETPVSASVFLDAAGRHMDDWWEGEDDDADSGVNHLSKAIACLMIIRDAAMRNNLDDDRPPKMPAGWMKGLDKQWAELVEKYPDPKQAVTELGLAEKKGGSK